MFKLRWPILVLAVMGSPIAMAIDVTVKLDGLDGAEARNARAFMAISTLNSDQNTMSRIRFLHRRAPDQIRRSLQPFGYYQVAIESTLTRTDEDEVTVHYQVDRGPQTRIRKLDFTITGEGYQDPAFRALLLEPGLAAGQPLVHSSYAALKAKVQRIAAERGFYDGRWTEQQIRVDRNQHQADINLHYDSGVRYRYGQFSFSSTPLKSSFIERFLDLEPGEPVFTTDLLTLQRRLNNTDYFQWVEVSPQWSDRNDGHVPIGIDLTMRKRTRYRTGFGFETDTGARVSAGVNRRWVNDSGHNFDSQVQLGQLRTDAVFQYMIPGDRPEFEQYSLRTAYRNEDVDPIYSETWASGISWQTKRKHWIQIIGFDWERETFELDDERERSRFLIPRISWSRTETENRLNPSSGYRVMLELLGSTDAWYSDTSFVQGRVELKLIDSFTPKWRWLARAEVGATVIEAADQLPASKRFFAGGDRSVRGYGYKSIAPSGDNGDLIGGQGLIVGSLETDYRFAESWRGALFIDHGAAVNAHADPLSTGIGLGARWISPIGPIRLDLAWALDKDDTPWRLHFSLGPDL